LVCPLPFSAFCFIIFRGCLDDLARFIREKIPIRTAQARWFSLLRKSEFPFRFEADKVVCLNHCL